MVFVNRNSVLAVLLLTLLGCSNKPSATTQLLQPHQEAQQAESFAAYWKSVATSLSPDFDASNIKVEESGLVVTGIVLKRVLYLKPLAIPGPKPAQMFSTGTPHAHLWRTDAGHYYVVVGEGCAVYVLRGAYGPFVQQDGKWQHL